MNTELITEMAQYLTFTLDSEIIAVNISKVREVLDLTTHNKDAQNSRGLCGG